MKEEGDTAQVKPNTPPTGQEAKRKAEGGGETARDVTHDRVENALRNCERFHGLAAKTATIDQLQASSVGIDACATVGGGGGGGQGARADGDDVVITREEEEDGGDLKDLKDLKDKSSPPQRSASGSDSSDQDSAGAASSRSTLEVLSNRSSRDADPVWALGFRL
jgi:hypothetical protein